MDPPASAWLAQRLRSFNLISIGLEPWWNDSRKRGYRARLGISHLVSRQVDIAPTLFWMLRGSEVESRRVLATVDEALSYPEIARAEFWVQMRRLLADPDEALRRRGRAFLEAGFGVKRLGDVEGVRRSLDDIGSPVSGRTWAALPGLEISPETAGAWIRAGLADRRTGVRRNSTFAVILNGTNVGDVVLALEAAIVREPSIPLGPDEIARVAIMTNWMTHAIERAQGGPAKRNGLEVLSR